jgi:hypothetical protein
MSRTDPSVRVETPKENWWTKFWLASGNLFVELFKLMQPQFVLPPIEVLT